MTNPLVSIVVAPPTPSVPAQTTVQFAAIANYFDHSSTDITTGVTWSSSDPSIASISNATSTNGLASTLTAGGPLTITASSGGISGSATLTTTNAPTLVNVLSNSYGVVLFNNGVTDNYDAWNRLQNAVPAGSALFFPKGKYYIDPTKSRYGWLLLKQLVLAGESSGSFDGSAVNDATLFLNPVILWPGSQVMHIAIDTRGLGVNYPADGVSSGSPIAGIPTNMRVDDVLYVAQGEANPAHGVLMQSGSNNQVSNIRAYHAFHAVAVRSPYTDVSNIYTYDSYDVVVKSATESGDVYNVSLSNITCDGNPNTNPNCIVLVESTDPGVSTHDVTLNSLFCNYGNNCLVFHTENGGEVRSITATNLDGNHVGTGIYTYTYSVGGGAMEQIAVSNGCFQNLGGSLLFNSANADIVLSNVGICNP